MVVALQDTVMHLIWAYGDSNPADHNSPLYHGATQRGTMDINFLDNGLAVGKWTTVKPRYFDIG